MTVEEPPPASDPRERLLSPQREAALAIRRWHVISSPKPIRLRFCKTLSEPLSVLPRLGIFSLYQDPLFVEGLKIFRGDEWRIAQVLRKCRGESRVLMRTAEDIEKREPGISGSCT